MNEFDALLTHAAVDSIKLELIEGTRSAHGLKNESLFHTPLLAFIILAICSQRRPLRTSEVGQVVGECIERCFSAFKGSAQYLGWSANLRMRTVSALGFLDMTELVKSNEKGHLSITPKGKKILDVALDKNDDLSMVIIDARKTYRDVISEKASQMELM